jgi:hypothetical protein
MSSIDDVGAKLASQSMRPILRFAPRSQHKQLPEPSGKNCLQTYAHSVVSIALLRYVDGSEPGASRRLLKTRSHVMKRTLIAIATLGILGSGVANAAGTTAVQTDRDFRSPMLIPVQQYDRWDDRSVTVNEREARINARIQRGLRDGRITNREARRLYNELADIEEKERAFGSDGRLSGRESAELNRDLDRLAEDVREQMRDEQRRY